MQRGGVSQDQKSEHNYCCRVSYNEKLKTYMELHKPKCNKNTPEFVGVSESYRLSVRKFFNLRRSHSLTLSWAAVCPVQTLNQIIACQIIDPLHVLFKKYLLPGNIHFLRRIWQLPPQHVHQILQHLPVKQQKRGQKGKLKKQIHKSTHDSVYPCAWCDQCAVKTMKTRNRISLIVVLVPGFLRPKF